MSAAPSIEFLIWSLSALFWSERVVRSRLGATSGQGLRIVVYVALKTHRMGADCITRKYMTANALKRSVRTSVILPEAAHMRLQALADANNVSAAWVIRAAVIQFLDEHGDETQLPLKLPRVKKGE